MTFKSKVGDSFTYLTEIKDLTIISKPDYFYLNSTIYPIEIIDKLKTEITSIDGRSNSASDLGVYKFNQDSFNSSITGVTGTLKVALKLYLYNKTEEDIDKITSSITNISGILREVLLKYNIKEDNLLSSIKGISGILRTVLITYNFYKTENIQNSISNVTSVLDQLNQSYEMFIKGNNEVYKYPSVMNRTMFRSVYNTLYQSEGTEEDLSLIKLTFNEPLQVIDAHNVVLMFGKVIGQTEPTVIVNEYTTSALNFETDLIDKISTTIWNKEGTATLTSVNKIFGENSFETKALGDSLSTTSNIITGGATPFTIEFYALIKSGSKGVSSPYQIYPLFSKANNVGAGEQFFYIDGSLGNKLAFQRQSNAGTIVTILGGQKNIRLNEINKFTFTYDSSALRLFINDKIDSIAGTLNGFVPTTSEPYRFLRNYVSSYSGYESNTLGLIDNINIHDGIATKVRDYDPYEEFLVVDLAFDGENNSTKIVDNGGDVLRSANPYNNNIISLLHFEGIDDSNIIIDETGRIWNVLGSSKIKTDQKIIGSSSCYFNGNSSISSSNSSDFAYGTSDFTWEFFTRLNVINENQYLIDHRQSNGNDGAISYYQNKLRYYNPTIGINSPLYNTNISLDINKWYHIAIVRNNNITSIYIDGVIRATGSDSHNFGNMECWLGAYSSGGNSLNGYIDELRIIKGKAVYVENFTPPNEAFKYIPNNKWTVLGNAKISTDQKFDGFSSLCFPVLPSNSIKRVVSSETIFLPKTEDFTLSFKFKRLPSSDQFASVLTTSVGYLSWPDAAWSINAITSSYPNQSYPNLRNKLSLINENNFTGYDSAIISNTTILDNVEYDVSFVKKDTFIYLYINGVLDVFSDVYKNNDIDFKNLCIGSELWTGQGNSFSGYIKNFKIYKGAAIFPKQKITSLITMQVASTSINSNLAWSTSGATLSTDSFTGNILNTSGNSLFNFYGSDFVLEFKFKGHGDLFTEWNTNLRFSLSVDVNGAVTFNFYETGPSLRTITSNNQTLLSTMNTLKVRRLNGLFSISLNDVGYILTQPNSPYVGGIYGPTTEGVRIGSAGVTTYSLDVYTEQADSVGKIQLDFDNNVTDKYGNSTWTNNGVTFDQVNSVKGYSAYFGNSANVYSSNINLNFEDKNFKITFDFKSLNVSNDAIVLLGTGHTSVPSSGVLNICYGTMQGYYFSKQNGTTLSSSNIVVNQYYKSELNRKNNVVSLYLNDVIVGSLNCNGETFDYSNNGTRIGYGAWASNSSHNGYIDNFKSEKDYQEVTVIDKPAVHFPLETNATNVGFADLTINSVGSPTYATIDNKKCIKFEYGKYLTINSNNIFNLGNNSDFYIEFDFYINTHKNYNFLLCNDNGYTNQLLTMIFINDLGQLKLRLINDNDIYTSNTLSLNTFHNFKIYRKNSSTFISLNNEIIQIINFNYNLSINGVFLGTSGWNNSSDYLNGYMSNFKMFVGTSEIPETYNDKKVLDLDFKPTRKSYLFKDNNNKCVIHPVNITQRDYQNSQYCCTFNGTDQYLQLGKNDLLNFGNDDFVINIKFNSTSTTGWRMIMCDNASSTNFIDIDADYKLLAIKVGGSRYDTPLNSIMPNTVYNVIIQVVNSILTVKINDIQSTLDGLPSQIVSNVNFNLSSNTFIGQYFDGTERFKGTIYSIKVLRNTSDITLLDDNNEIDPYLPLQVTISNPPVQINPINGTVIQVTGTIKNSIQIPVLTATLDGDPVSESDIFISENSDASYTYLIRLFTDNLDGKHTLEVSVQDDAIVEYVTTTIEVVKDIILKTNLVDSFGTSWYNCNPNKQVTIRKFEDEPMLYFDGDTALYSTNNSYKLGLASFTIELDVIVTNTGNNVHLLSYGRSSNSSGWYSLERNANGSLRFTIDKSSNNYLETNINLINMNTKYRISITRDVNFNLRIFIDGIKVAEKVDKTVIDSTPNSDSNILYLGRSGILYNDNTNKHFKGYIGNFYLNRSECKYTSDYTVEDYIIGLDSKSLLTFTSEDVGFSTKVDSFESDITWTNTGCTVVDNKLLFNGNTTRLLSSEYDTFILNNNNWTIDLIFKCNQINTGTTLLDLRLNNNSFNGILITQPAADPTSILISVGDSTATQAYSYTLSTGINSVNTTKEYRLKLVRSANELLLFLDGVLKQKTTINLVSITTPNKLCLGNNLGYTTGFNGYIKQFRLLNGTASDVYAFPVIEGETLE